MRRAAPWVDRVRCTPSLMLTWGTVSTHRGSTVFAVLRVPSTHVGYCEYSPWVDRVGRCVELGDDDVRHVRKRFRHALVAAFTTAAGSGITSAPGLGRSPLGFGWIRCQPTSLCRQFRPKPKAAGASAVTHGRYPVGVRYVFLSTLFVSYGCYHYL